MLFLVRTTLNAPSDSLLTIFQALIVHTICVRYEELNHSCKKRGLIRLIGEEVKDAANFVPQSMGLRILICGVFVFAFCFVLLFGIGDLTAGLSTPTTFLVVQIYKNATQLNQATNATVVALITSMIFSAFGPLA